MAGLNGLKAMFSMNQVRNVLQEKVNSAEQKSIESMQYLGEEFVNNARAIDTYDDQTGNLRSSIGYIILKDGEVIDENFRLSNKGTDRNSGMEKAKEYIQEIAAQNSKGLVLIGVAGMNYAAAVESLGYDVITGSAPNANDIKDLLGAIKL